MRFALDSAQNSGILLPSAVAARLDFSRLQGSSAKLLLRKLNSRLRRATSRRTFGSVSHTLLQPKVEFADMIREGNFGATIFKQSVVTFDRKNKRVEFVARKL